VGHSHHQHHHNNDNNKTRQVILNFHQLSRLYGPSIQVHSFKVSPCGNKFAVVLFDPTSSTSSSSPASPSTLLFQGPCLVKSSPHHDWVEVGALGHVGDVEWCSHGNGLVATKYIRHHDGDGSGSGKVVVLYAPIIMLMNETAGLGDGLLQVLWEQGDVSATIQLTQCKDNSHILINSMTKRSSEVSLIRSGDPLGSCDGDSTTDGAITSGNTNIRVLTVHPRQYGLEYFVEHHQGSLYILSNAQGMVNWGVFSIDVGRLYRECHLDRTGRGAYDDDIDNRAGVSTVSSDEWRCILPERQGVALEDIDVFQHGVVVHERNNARPQLRYIPSPTITAASDDSHTSSSSDLSLLDNSKVVALPEWAHDVVPGANADYNSSTFRMGLSSPVHPPQQYDYHFESGRVEKLASSAPRFNSKNKKNKGKERVFNGLVQKVEKLEGGECHQVHVPSSSSSSSSSLPVTIPMTLAHKSSSSSSNGISSPCLIVVYGAYGACHIQPGWEEHTAALVEKGWVLAHAHVRGGGEKGRRWHLDGVLDTKHNSISDLGDCIQWLVDNGYTEYDKVVVWGKSAGAVAVAGYLNSKAASYNNDHRNGTGAKKLSSSSSSSPSSSPSIVRGAILETPFLDMLGEMTDPSLDHINAREREEWGDPGSEQGMALLRKYCPLTNIVTAGIKSEGKGEGSLHQSASSLSLYPPYILVTCNTTDTMVTWQGALKYVTKLRTATNSSSNVMMYVNAFDGHYVPGDKCEEYYSTIFTWAMNAIKRV